MDGFRGFCGLCCKRVPHGADYRVFPLIGIQAHDRRDLLKQDATESKRLANDLHKTHAAEMQAFADHECLVSCLSNACIRINQMPGFDLIKWVHSFRSNACSCMLRMREVVCMGTGWMGHAPFSMR